MAPPPVRSSFPAAQRFTIGGKDGEDLIQVIIIFEAFVKALFESHAGKQQDAHRQPQRQREDFDNVGTMPRNKVRIT